MLGLHQEHQEQQQVWRQQPVFQIDAFSDDEDDEKEGPDTAAALRAATDAAAGGVRTAPSSSASFSSSAAALRAAAAAPAGAEAAAAVDALLEAALERRVLRALRLRHGQGATLQRAAEELGVPSHQRAHQIIERGVARAREAVARAMEGDGELAALLRAAAPGEDRRQQPEGRGGAGAGGRAARGRD
jgi:hypothetical protein